MYNNVKCVFLRFVVPATYEIENDDNVKVFKMI